LLNYFDLPQIVHDPVLFQSLKLEINRLYAYNNFAFSEFPHCNFRVALRYSYGATSASYKNKTGDKYLLSFLEIKSKLIFSSSFRLFVIKE